MVQNDHPRMINLHLGGHRRGILLLRQDALVHTPDLEPADGLEQARAVVASGEVGVLQHLLGDLSVELGGDVAQVGFDVDELVQLVELAVHLQHRHFVAVVRVWAIEELNSWVRASELAAARNPRDRGTLVEEVHGLEEGYAFLHHHAHAQYLAFVVIGDQLRGQHLDHDVGVLLLGICKFTIAY